MRVMVIVKATADTESGDMSSPEVTKMFEAMGKFNKDLENAGIMLGGGMGLKPSSAGKRVALSGSRRSVTDGPFTETKELIAGFWLWQVKDMDEAVEWAKKCPYVKYGPDEIEIRPAYELEDFADVMTPKVAESEKLGIA